MKSYVQKFTLRLVKDGRLQVNCPIVRTPEDVVDLLRAELDSLPFEKFVAIPLTTRNHVIGLIDVSTGTLNSSLVSGRDLFLRLILSGGCSVILAHNHPSGMFEVVGSSAMPSPEDVDLTQRLVEIGKVLDFPVLDHIVIAGSQYYSFKAHGRI